MRSLFTIEVAKIVAEMDLGAVNKIIAITILRFYFLTICIPLKILYNLNLKGLKKSTDFYFWN